ncbi:GspE family protein [Anaerostipes hadrus]|uniref:GspE family protein n=2 Tax=Anaerostipes hadrus TaxID=649756 RepID=UPI001D025802|nr:GspE family protein [Anaerostipes hadrus]MCB5544086.1 GspE family protein [Anaerostipes hadrus]
MSNSDKIIELSKYESFMEEPKKFEESIYSSTYKKTKSLVKKLLDESEYIEEEKLRRKIGALDKKEINNMIAFVGKRGTGKTTAMFSFLNYLNTYGNSVYEEPFREIDFGSVKFHCLDFIDGGLLEKEENILHILVANMYRKFMETSEERFHDDWR